MQIDNLRDMEPGAEIETDVAIVGGGAAGLTLAREFAGAATRVLVLESGDLDEHPEISALNAVESVGEPGSLDQALRRTAFHGAHAPFWSHEIQPYGLRCRVLGGSTHAWMGKSAAFDEIDFSKRAWVPYSGWPFGLHALSPYLERAGAALNLGPHVYDEKLWDLLGTSPPKPALDAGHVTSFFWQFARSRQNPVQIMRLGAEFRELRAPNVRTLINATATQLFTDPDGQACTGVEVSTLEGRRARVNAKVVVLACSAIENARLLLASNRTHANGLGNQHDVVGRFLMDHVSGRLVWFDAKECAPLIRRFGMYGAKLDGRVRLYMHGVALSRRLQAQEELLNCAAYCMEERAPDDPWDALKRLMLKTSKRPAQDMLAVASSPGLLIKGIGKRLLEQELAPKAVRQAIADVVIRYFPTFAAREHQSRGLPHKLTGLWIDGISEQAPNPDSRITLSAARDRLGAPLAKIDWRIEDRTRRSLMHLGRSFSAELARTGLPAGRLEDWITQERPQDAVLIDMGHTAGTTRMSDDPRFGVVDPDCRVHGVHGLYVAGASVFPTSGHANPTLMILSLAIRLADHLKAVLDAPVAVSAGERRAS